ncbi:MAG TPA: hypothetical protein VM243_02950 [Phycisphaerae bacterium]|nr:hypothetical protein [Phycisphaerae bacterium]
MTIYFLDNVVRDMFSLGQIQSYDGPLLSVYGQHVLVVSEPLRRARARSKRELYALPALDLSKAGNADDYSVFMADTRLIVTGFRAWTREINHPTPVVLLHYKHPVLILDPGISMFALLCWHRPHAKQKAEH